MKPSKCLNTCSLPITHHAHRIHCSTRIPRRRLEGGCMAACKLLLLCYRYNGQNFVSLVVILRSFFLFFLYVGVSWRASAKLQPWLRRRSSAAPKRCHRAWKRYELNTNPSCKGSTDLLKPPLRKSLMPMSSKRKPIWYRNHSTWLISDLEKRRQVLLFSHPPFNLQNNIFDNRIFVSRF